MMQKITMDMETRGVVDLTKCGTYRYAKDPNTDIMCISSKWGGDKTETWNLMDADADPEDILYMIDQTDIINAHNVQFERVMWTEIMVKRYGYPEIPFHKWRCTAAKAAAHALPRDLDRACAALNLPIQKDYEGYKLMMKLCRPRKPQMKKKKQPNGTWKITWLEDEHGVYWHEDPDDIKRLLSYCETDVEAEYALDQRLNDLSPLELEIWRLDQLINDRGIYADRGEVENIIGKIASNKTLLEAELGDLTNGTIRSATQAQATRDYIAEFGVLLPNMQKETVTETLRTDLPEDVRRILELRQVLAKSSVAKFEAMLKGMDEDGRMRGTLLYHGAGTGRWAGKRIQPHNFLRACWKDPDTMLPLYLDSCADDYKDTYWDMTIAASMCLRGVLRAAPANDLLCADFSSIEAIVLAWLAGEQHVLDAVIAGLDLYKVIAAEVYHVDYDAVTHDMRQVGKTCVLALGYQGWLGAFSVMARSYDVSYPAHLKEKISERVISKAHDDLNSNDRASESDKKEARRILKTGVTEQDIFETWARPIIMNYRDSHPAIRRFWGKVMEAVVNTVSTGKAHAYGPVMFGMREDFLHCRLPSGRLLSYYQPELPQKTDTYGRTKTVLSYMHVNSETNQWERTYSYGGKITENITQAVARDLLAEGMLRCEKAGLPIVLHVHDELVAEVPKSDPTKLADFYALMSELPEWAEGCPVTADGWRGLRYRK
jgi:DNA polymerase